MKEQITKETHPEIYNYLKYLFQGNRYVYDDIFANSFYLIDGKINYEYMSENVIFKENISFLKYPNYTFNGGASIIPLKLMWFINFPSVLNINKYISINQTFGLEFLSFKGLDNIISSKTIISTYNGFKQSFSNDLKDKDKYKIYLAMWLEMLDSITEEERWKYIKKYTNKRNITTLGDSIIPKEILLEFGVLI